MQGLYSSFDFISSFQFLLNWQHGAGALALLIVSFVLLYAGFPIGFTLTGTAILFATYALVTGRVSGEIFTSFGSDLASLLSSNTLQAIPLLLFATIILERAYITENIIEKFTTHWRHKSETMLYTGSFVDLLVSVLATFVCFLFAPLAALRLPLYLKTKHHGLLTANTTTPNIRRGPLSTGLLNKQNYIPLSVMLILIAEVTSKALHSPINGSKAQQGGQSLDSAAYTATDFLIAAIVPGAIFITLYSLYHLALMFKSPNDYVFKNNTSERGGSSSSRTELLNSLIAPVIYVAIVVSALMIVKLPLIEVAAIAAIGSLVLVSHKAAPDNAYIQLIAIGSFGSLFVLNKLFTLEINQVPSSLLNGAVMALSLLLVSFMVYAVYRAVVPLSKPGTGDEATPEQSFMGKILMETLEHSTKLITLFIAASLYLAVFKGCEGDTLVKTLYESLTGNNSLAPIVTLICLFMIAKVLSPIVALLFATPILLSQLNLFVKLNTAELNVVWFGVLLIITLQLFGAYSLSKNDKKPNEMTTDRRLQTTVEELNSELYQVNMPVITLQLLIIALCWFLPQILLV